MCGFYYVLDGVAFCQLLLNEYCIVLCCRSLSNNVSMYVCTGGFAFV